MDKKLKKVNTLIKRKGLVNSLRKAGIKRISKNAEQGLNLFFLNYFEHVFLGLKEEMEILGKRVFDEKVLDSFISNQNKEEEIDY